MRTLPMFTKKHFFKILFLKDFQKYCGIASFDRVYEVRCVRRAAAKIFISKKDYDILFKFVHAPRDMTAHLTRCAYAHSADVH